MIRLRGRITWTCSKRDSAEKAFFVTGKNGSLLSQLTFIFSTLRGFLPPMKSFSLTALQLSICALLAAAGLSAGAAPKPPEPPPLSPEIKVSSPGTPEDPVVPSVVISPPKTVHPRRGQQVLPPVGPPVMITRIQSADVEDWARTPNDLKGLLESIGEELHVAFASDEKTFSTISSKPSDNPVLYRSGYKKFALTDQETTRLREYVQNGGTIIFNSLVGHPDSYESAKIAIGQIFPDRPLYRLRLDHPVFRSYHRIEKVAYRDRMKKDGLITDPFPFLEGVDVDNRTAIILSRWDFALGWEANAHESWGYENEDARKLGTNIVAYVTALREAGKSVGKSVSLSNAEVQSVAKFRVGQVRYNGAWRGRSSGMPMLLNQLSAETGTRVSFLIKDVSLKEAEIFELPFLYLSGTSEFALSEEERLNLRRYLSNGGILFVEAAEGRISFDKAFRQEMTKILPQKPLIAIPQGHDIFRLPRVIQTVRARPTLAQARGNRVQQNPELYGVEINGTLGVIYTPFDWSAGWEKADAPFAIGYEPQDATALGVNVLFYSLTH